MPNPIARNLPTEELRVLEFLIGEFSGVQTLYPPESPPVQYPAHVTGEWERCERFFKFDFYAEIPGIGVETFRALLTYSESKTAYRMWVFAASQEEPVHMMGNFHGDQLVLISDPTPMVWGMQRLRYSFRPLSDGGCELLGERWEPDGYAKYCTVTFRPKR